MPPAPRPPRARPRLRHKAVTFCGHHPRARTPAPPAAPAPPAPRAASYYSDPGREDKPARGKDTAQPRSDSTDSDIRYYSEPDAKYFEIDYEFLKELRRIARNNCPKCRRKRSRRNDRGDYKEKSSKDKKPPRSSRLKENYVYCNGRYHSDKEHCQLCCRVCNRSTDTLDSIDDDQYSMVSKSYSQPKAPSRPKSTPRKSRERKNSIQSNKSVSFLESSNDGGDESIREEIREEELREEQLREEQLREEQLREELREEPNYTAKSFTNDLKKFLLKPSAPRQSLRDKFITSFKQEFEATKKSPKLKAIKGLWKSY